MHVYVAVTSRLEGDIIASCNKVLGKEQDVLRQRIETFANHSRATIQTVKRKYDELRLDFDELKHHLDTSPVQVKSEGETTTTGSLCKSFS